MSHKPKEEPVVEHLPKLDGFEYVPSIGLYVLKQRILHENNWDQQQEALHSRNDRMITPSEFTEFIKHLRTKNDQEFREILDEILTQRSPWRGEYLDARFEKIRNRWIMHYHTFNDKGEIEEKTQDLKGVLMEDRLPGIDLDSWLNDNKYGLPKTNIPNGHLWYYHPRNGAVARFDADSYGVSFYCYRNPQYSNSSLGVRAVRRAAQNLGMQVNLLEEKVRQALETGRAFEYRGKVYAPVQDVKVNSA